MMWIWIILALIYLLSPYDLIPGLHGVGWIDDILVLFFLYRYLANLKKASRNQPPPNGYQRPEPPPGNGRTSEAYPKTPHEILGVAPTADQDEIKAAYRRLAGQYHPDKVAHLGKELQEMAEQRFKEIQSAYDQLVQR